MDSQIITDDQGDYVGRRFKCRCNAWLESYMGSDIDCSSCGRLFNSVGQELNTPTNGAKIMTTKQKTLTLPYYQDPGHGWVRVSIGLLHGLKIAEDISSYSYRRDSYAYLEEDCDLSRLLAAAEAAGITIKLKQHHTNKTSKIRGYAQYSTPHRAAAAEAAIKAKILAQGCSLDFLKNKMIIKVITL